MKAFIIGYYGSENIGDEVLLHQVIRMIREIDHKASIKSLSYRTSRTYEIHGIESVSRNKYTEIGRAIKESDIIIGGGGSMLQNVTSNRSLIYYLALIHLAKVYGKRIILLGNGFGPIQGGFFRKLSRKVLNKIDIFVARDLETVEALKNIGVTTEIESSADLAYYGYRSKTRIREKKIVINLRPWHEGSQLIEEMAKLIEHLLSKGYEISFLSMQKGRDDQIHQALEENLGMSIAIEPNTIDRFINHGEEIYCLIGMRLHALIWAGIKDIPMIGISYDPKIDAYLNQTGQINSGSVDALTAENLIESFEKLESDYEAYQKTLLEKNIIIASDANKNRQALERLIGGKK
jgi:polysaccharide pyruvyl transferase CsaB